MNWWYVGLIILGICMLADLIYFSIDGGNLEDLGLVSTFAKILRIIKFLSIINISIACIVIGIYLLVK